MRTCGLVKISLTYPMPTKKAMWLRVVRQFTLEIFESSFKFFGPAARLTSNNLRIFEKERFPAPLFLPLATLTRTI